MVEYDFFDHHSTQEVSFVASDCCMILLNLAQPALEFLFWLVRYFADIHMNWLQ